MQCDRHDFGGADGNIGACESACLNQCSCMGYSHGQDNRCLTWKGPLINLRQFSENNTLYTNEFYLKLADRPDLLPKDTNSTNGTVTDSGFKNTKDRGNNQLRKIVIPTASFAVVVTLGLFSYYATRRKLRRKGE
ncbi:G-type lectin S-receptor-like serine/threonine-protein kinase At1g11410 [Corylus avellana]|uniref:G-type lectin S-receptor-like serine/threonine-protein kinase At1g11410 n=1 Tax=Corylus avellana TaxID=13451 RepID=UPI00286C0924|nr:G-type lectin S-receptor-like serine/threonine-protein kinase At1g11410 [Corylus avellana]